MQVRREILIQQATLLLQQHEAVQHRQDGLLAETVQAHLAKRYAELQAAIADPTTTVEEIQQRLRMFESSLFVAEYSVIVDSWF